ncbi:cytochrome b5 domain-containing protein 1 [Periplaneta americana]|uniref:cytochrome b5 domain-containing protein 1 n=1 Tax=Periplaneta americana TaxID=6978 RepID=UPI0037E8F7C6
MTNVYYLPSEVVIHNTPDDIWVTYLGRVYNLTELVKEYEGQDVIKPILAFAGKDISHWFDRFTGEIRHMIHPITGARVPYTPHGRIPHVGLHVPTTAWRPLQTLPWWADPKYLIGNLTQGMRNVRVLNVLTGQENVITVCKEDKLSRIMERLMRFNSHCASYTFKFETRVLDMDKTLEENHIPDERETFCDVGLPEDYYIPCLMLYYNDDFTTA